MALPHPGGAASLQPSVGESDLEKRFSDLLDWLQEGVDAHDLGKHVPPLKDTFAISEGEFGKSLISKRRIEQGTVIALVPLQHLITDKNFSVITGNKTTDDLLDRYTKISIFLNQQLELGEFSLLWPYLRMLPHGQHNLPKYWDQALLRRHLGVSKFTETAAESRILIKDLFTSLLEGTHLQLSDFEWAYDIARTRGFQADNALGSNEFLMLMPLLDLALHSDFPNVRYEWDNDLKALKATACRRIFPGQEMFLNYFGGGSPSNLGIFENWGFTSERSSVKKTCTLLHIRPEDAWILRHQVLGQWDAMTEMEMPQPNASTIAFLYRRLDTVNFTLCDDATDLSARSFLGYMRFVAGGGSGVSAPSATQATTWFIEANALKMALRIIETESEKYHKASREASTGDNISDTAVRFLAVIRHDEEATLQWWINFLTHALRHVPEDLEASVDESYIKGSWTHQLFKSASLSRMQLGNEMKMAQGYLPEIALALLLMMVAADVFCWLVAGCAREEVLFWRYRWPLSIGTCLLCTIGRVQDMKHVMERMAIPWILTALVYVPAMLIHLICIGDLRFDKEMLSDVASVLAFDLKRLSWSFAPCVAAGGLCIYLAVQFELLMV